MIVSEFEVGDRVRLVNPQDCDLDYRGYEKGEELIVQYVDYDGDIRVKSKDYGFLYGHQVEPIPEEGEDSMKNVDAIAVEGENIHFREGVIDEAKKNGFDWKPNITPDSGRKYIILTKDGYINSTNTPWEHQSFPDEKLKSPQDWNKVVEFLEQESQPTPELNGYEAGIVSVTGRSELSQIKVGCWKGVLGDLEKFKQICEDNGVRGGQLNVKGDEVDLDELFDFIEDVKEVVKNG